jgi:hypothetical protein
MNVPNVLKKHYSRLMSIIRSLHEIRTIEILFRSFWIDGRRQFESDFNFRTVEILEKQIRFARPELALVQNLFASFAT